ncbi:MAG: hypothetical protein LBL92_04580, partial [Propionibacteriaceae bacterium]|nr:hypothetical protein [Propionibacteriaceae bacterium]
MSQFPSIAKAVPPAAGPSLVGEAGTPGRPRRRLRRRPTLLAGLVIVTGLVVVALVSWFWTPYDPALVDAANRLQGPSWSHWLGTDRMGIDIVSRLMIGARTTLTVGILAVLGAIVVGVPFGVMAGMTRSALSDLILRLGDILFALPALLLAMLLVAARGASITTAT